MSVQIYDANGNAYEADLVDGDKYRQLERENAALRADKERVMELIRLWETQWPTYPNTTEGAYGAAAVRCCIRELRAALDAARKEQP